MPIRPAHDRLHIRRVPGIDDRAADQLLLRGDVEGVVRVRVLHVPAVEQGLVVELDMLRADGVPELDDGGFEGFATHVGWEGEFFSAGDTGGECLAGVEARLGGSGFGDEGLGDALVGLG